MCTLSIHAGVMGTWLDNDGLYDERVTRAVIAAGLYAPPGNSADTGTGRSHNQAKLMSSAQKYCTVLRYIHIYKYTQL